MATIAEPLAAMVSVLWAVCRVSPVATSKISMVEVMAVCSSLLLNTVASMVALSP